MTDAQRWQADNAHALAAAVNWLRTRLETMAPDQEPKPVPGRGEEPPAPRTAPIMEEPPSLFSWSTNGSANGLFNPTPAQTATTAPVEIESQEQPAAPPSEDHPSDENTGDYEAPPALRELGSRFGLTPFEQNILLLCTAMEMDTRIAPLCARAQGNPQCAYPTFSLALSLFENASWDAFVPERPLRYWRLLEINQPGATPLTASPLCADERIVHYIKGANYLDDRLANMLSPLYLDGESDSILTGLPPSQQQVVDTIVTHWQQTPAGSVLPVAQLLGADIASKHFVAETTAARLGYQLCRFTVDMLPANQAELETLTRLWQRERMLLPLALYVDAQDLDAEQGQLARVQRFLARSDGLIFLGIREALPHAGRATFTLDVDRPTPAEQQDAWQTAIPTLTPQDVRALAGQFDLTTADIRRIAPIANGLAAVKHAPPPSVLPAAKSSRNNALVDVVWEVCCDNERPRMDALAQRLNPKATWNDLVLPAAETTLLRQIAAQVRQRTTVYDEWGFRSKMNRGMGISALFAGASGTGKTMAAEVIANDLRLNLYRIDLSAVVSKYIGETEKNLRKLFDAAEGGSAILFFDEADALFGKRSEVKDSHDRYANIEINYLLQRMEEFSGLAILATNMKSALDKAFMRRLRFIVNFRFPGPDERKVMWQKVFPAQIQEQHLGANRLAYEKLARLNLTGGSIHNVALNAAFAAAHAGEPITMDAIWDAARMELRKLEKPVNEGDFR